MCGVRDGGVVAIGSGCYGGGSVGVVVVCVVVMCSGEGGACLN